MPGPDEIMIEAAREFGRLVLPDGLHVTFMVVYASDGRAINVPVPLVPDAGPGEESGDEEDEPDADDAPTVRIAEGQPPPELTRAAHRKIWLALDDREPRTRQKAARLAGYSFNSTFQTNFKQILDSGHARQVSGGYVRCRPASASADASPG